MIAATDPALPEPPAVRSVWRHTNGRLYRVEEITNREPGRQDRYPTTVVYRNVKNGEPYTRRLADWHRSMTLAQDADDPDNIVNSDREGFMVEAALYHGFEMTNDDGTTFSCTQDQIIALLTAAYAPIKAAHVNADPAVVEKAIEKIKAANPMLVLESGTPAPFPLCPGETITMTGLGLGERPASINDWINRECDKFEEHGLTPHDAAEIARGAVLHMIADKAALITNLANEVHAANVAAGWWTDLKTGEDLHGRRNVGELLCLVHSELSEAIDGTNAADQVFFGLRAAIDNAWTGVGAQRDQLLAVHQSVSRAMEGHRKSLMDDKLPHRPTFRVELVDALIRLLDILGSDNREHPAGTIFAEKREFNASRADHKPENRRQHGGKGY